MPTATTASATVLSDEHLKRSTDERYRQRQHVEAQGLQAYELAECAGDVAWFVNRWALTYDPRLPSAMLPFDLFPKQQELLSWLSEREQSQSDGLIEKSRDMGATWLCCAYALHRWLFRPGASIGFGSRKLELVDRLGDPDSIFEKLRMLLYNLPAWFLPQGYSREEHDNLARLVNPANGATVTGEGGDNIGRGGRKLIYFVDEAAYLERPEAVERALSQTTNVRIDVSTPNGPGNPFARKRFAGHVSVFTLHWRDDPRKGAEWYAAQKKRFDAVTVAQEIDIDYTASIEGIAIPAAWVRAAVGLELEASGPVVGGFDVAEMGKDSSVLVARQGPVVAWPIAWGQCNTTEGAWRCAEHARRLGIATLTYDCGGPGAGIRGPWMTAEGDLGFHARPVNSGESPSEDHWPDGQTSKQKFTNLRAEMWWKLRLRFERTYEWVEHGVAHPAEEMISIPHHPQLIAELSLPLSQRTEAGKIQLESKKDMRKRGIKSPDFADALALAFLASAEPGLVAEVVDSLPRCSLWGAVVKAGAASIDERRQRADEEDEGDDWAPNVQERRGYFGRRQEGRRGRFGRAGR